MDTAITVKHLFIVGAFFGVILLLCAIWEFLKRNDPPGPGVE